MQLVILLSRDFSVRFLIFFFKTNETDWLARSEKVYAVLDSSNGFYTPLGINKEAFVVVMCGLIRHR